MFYFIKFSLVITINSSFYSPGKETSLPSESLDFFAYTAWRAPWLS